MSNKFEIQVVALDKFTSTFRKLNNSASKAVRPLTNVSRQVGALSRELHLDKIAKGMGKISQVSLGVARNLGAATAPLENLLGLGVAGGIAGLVGSVTALGARWGNLGYEVARTSSLMGVSERDLQRYRGAAGLAGVSSEALTGSLRSLGDTLQDALYGRNPQALIILNKLGIGIKRNAAGVVDSVAAFTDLSRAISKIEDPRVQALIARAFGLEQALPLLRQGPEAVEKLSKEAEKFGLVASGSAVQGAVEFGNALNRLKAAAEGLANTWGQKITPILTRGMNFLTGDMEKGASRTFGDAMRDAGHAVLFPMGSLVNGISSSSKTGKRSDSGRVTEPDGAPAAGSAAGGPVAWDAQQAERDREGLRIVQMELDREKDPGERAALQREVSRRQASLAQFQQAGAAPSQPVHVVVEMKNAPPGTTVQAKQGNNFLPTRISYSMPTTTTP